MKKQEFQEWIRGRIIFLDGATGSNLQRRGMPAGVCPELWVMEHPDVMKQLQQEYIQAGSDIIYAPTFSGNRINMKGVRPGGPTGGNQCRTGRTEPSGGGWGRLWWPGILQ